MTVSAISDTRVATAGPTPLLVHTLVYADGTVSIRAQPAPPERGVRRA